MAEGLEGWLWPKVNEDLWVDQHTPMEKSSIFNALVTQADNATAQIILKRAITDAWVASEHGIIIGTSEFDRIGKTGYTHRNGLLAMRGILQQLGLDPKDVTVVLNYRTPRRDQWISIWKHADADVHYYKFLCHGNEKELLELVDTSMNPLKLAQLYRKEKWNVVLMDMSGVDAMGKDISHAIACDVLEQTKCQDGFVVPVMQTYTENYGDKDFGSLGDKEQQDLDQIFLERDCYYEPSLRDDGGFQILYRDTIWQGCLRPEESEEEEKTQQELYQHLSDPATLLDAIKAQKGCAKNGFKMNNVLVGKNYTSMVVSTIGTKKDEDGSTSEVDEEDVLEGLLGGEEPLLAKKSKNRDSPWLTAFLVLVAGFFGVYQLHLIQRNGRRLHHGQHNDQGGQELVGFSENSNPGLSIAYRPDDLSLDPPPDSSDGDII